MALGRRESVLEKGWKVRARLSWITVVSAALVLASAGTASADATLGSTTIPSGSTAAGCGPSVIAEPGSDPSTPYTIPSAGAITQWQVNTTGDTAGATISLVILRSAGATTYSVVGVDTKTLPNPLPAGNIATFATATPITVAAGDILGLYSTSGAACYYSGGTTPAANTLIALTSASTPTAGQTLSVGGPSGASFELDLSATLSTTSDAGVTATAAPSAPAVGSLANLTATVSNAGPNTGAITFTDGVPAGLTIDSAVAGSGTCVVAGQTVTCTITALAPGQTSNVSVVVTPTAVGSYTNTVSVALVSGTDPNAANNTASASLTVGAMLLTPKCVIPTLRGLTASFAKTLLGLLGCTVGNVTHAASKTVPKGLVIASDPGASTVAAGQAVAITVSSGRPPKKHKHKRKH